MQRAYIRCCLLLLTGFWAGSSTIFASTSGQLIRAQETTRTQIARDLHDDIAQRLSLVAMDLTTISDSSNKTPSGFQKRIEELSTRLSAIGSDLHRLSHELHPALLEQLGLEAAVSQFCAELSAARHIAIDVSVSGVPSVMPSEVALGLYRITQEALHNVARHSGASSATVHLDTIGEDVVLRVVDGGSGFDPDAPRAAASLGLRSIEERVHLLNGQVSVRSTKGEGTRLEVCVPLRITTPASTLSGLPEPVRVPLSTSTQTTRLQSARVP